MKNIYKKIYSVLLILILILLAACGNGNVGNKGENTELNTETAVQNETMQSDYSDLPDIKFEGREFMILYPSYKKGNLYLTSESENGEILNDASFRRNLDVEERFDISIKELVGNDDISKDMLKFVMSGDDSVDLLISHPRLGVSSLITEGLLYNWFDLKYIDLSKPCWNKDIQTSFLVSDKLFYSNGDLTVMDPGILVLTFNKEMAENLKRENPYNYVFNGAWTIDRLMEYTKDVYNDVNGDGNRDNGDIYGYINDENEYQYLYTSGLKVTQPDAEGRQALSLLGERLTTLVDKMNVFLHGNDTLLARNSDARQLFMNGRGLIGMYEFAFWPQFRDIEFEFGILPLPKFDEAQERHCVFTGLGLTGVPSNVKDPDNTSIIIQAFMEESYRYMRPAYLDVVLYVKCLRDEESQKMMELILNNRSYDFGYTFGVEDYSKRMEQIISNVVTKNKSTDIMSYYEKYSALAQANYDKIFEYCTQQ